MEPLLLLHAALHRRQLLLRLPPNTLTHCHHYQLPGRGRGFSRKLTFHGRRDGGEGVGVGGVSLILCFISSQPPPNEPKINT